ncbi:MAG TPA: TA system VapC family ribonuclease toxin [Verrucomicrobiae bacterium]|nr:TA system VapC family ribonuclease toxin [Verrucomicrobiae bacterium]
MRALLDINVLIALLDPDHVFHDRAHTWWKGQARSGWASCPLTENGLVRIMSNPAYSRAEKFGPGDLIERVDLFASQSNHEFWPDELSLRDKTVFARDRLHSSRTTTDIYLLALAVKHRGFLATFDPAIPVSAVRGAATESLFAI